MHNSGLLEKTNYTFLFWEMAIVNYSGAIAPYGCATGACFQFSTSLVHLATLELLFVQSAVAARRAPLCLPACVPLRSSLGRRCWRTCMHYYLWQSGSLMLSVTLPVNSLITWTTSARRCVVDVASEKRKHSIQTQVNSLQGKQLVVEMSVPGSGRLDFNTRLIHACSVVALWLNTKLPICHFVMLFISYNAWSATMSVSV